MTQEESVIALEDDWIWEEQPDQESTVGEPEASSDLDMRDSLLVRCWLNSI